MFDSKKIVWLRTALYFPSLNINNPIKQKFLLCCILILLWKHCQLPNWILLYSSSFFGSMVEKNKFERWPFLLLKGVETFVVWAMTNLRRKASFAQQPMQALRRSIRKKKISQRYIKIILLWIVCKTKSIVEGWKLKRGLRLTKVLISRTQTAWCLARGRGPAARWRTRTASAEWASITRGVGTRALALASQRRQKQECSSDKCPVQGNTICVYTERWKGILSRSG